MSRTAHAPAVVTRPTGTDIVIAEWDEFADERLSHDLAQVLTTTYPGYSWGVHVNSRGGVVNILNLTFSGEMGYRFKIRKLDTDLPRLVMRAGGEILERFDHPRRRFDADIHRALPRDFRGRIVHDQ